ncbi:MAG: putative bifunctional diguanylate cyclase/phosphodiesterase [Gemmatimonadaceae bacterium]
MPSPNLSELIPRELIQREKWLMQKEWVRQATYVRFSLLVIGLTMAAIDVVFDVLPAPWELFVAVDLFGFMVNGLVVWGLRRDLIRPWHVWALLGNDSIIIGILAASIGELSYLAIPFYLLASIAYSLNIPRAARVQLGVALVCYPIARAFGLHHATGAWPLALLLTEEVCLAGIGYLAVAGPIRFTYRVRGARRALGALARGDFSVRLPARALDDLGFLAVSFNDTADRLGQAMQLLEEEIDERTRAEHALRASKDALTHQAFHDPLTGLPNRARFREQVAAALTEAPRRTAVLAVDLDGFKTVNDTFGHAGGDALLVEVAARLQSATRGSDVVARLGGDEFAVLLRFLHDENETRVVADRILTSIDTPVMLGDRATSVGASIGIAIVHCRPDGEGQGSRREDREDIDPVDALMHDADVALYHAKTRGKGRWTRFDPSMHDAAAERRTLKSDLRRALARNELEVHYQPIVSLVTGRIDKVEALLRWSHPTRGPVSPAEFIPLAEDSGLIIPLGRWLLTTACHQLARWQRAIDEREPGRTLAVSVNVSGRQLQHAGFVSEVAAVLRETGVHSGSVVLELTESAVIHHPDTARARMLELKEAGAQLAIDDFGTGYSSLSYLQHFPVDVLKIDRSFVEGVALGGPQEALLRTILMLGRALSLQTVAEGIETEQQRSCVAAMGCDFGQGYLFAHPMAADAVDDLLGIASQRA